MNQTLFVVFCTQDKKQWTIHLSDATGGCHLKYTKEQRLDIGRRIYDGELYDGDMGLEHMMMPNVHEGVDIYDADMNMDGMTIPNIFSGEDYFSMLGNADEILSYDDPLIHSKEYQMDSFVFAT